MRPGLKFKRIGGRQLRRVRQMYDQATCPRLRRRAQTILLAQQGYPTAEIAQVTRQSPMNVRRLLHQFEEQGCAGLLEASRSGRPAEITPAIESYLRTVVVQAPRAFGFARPGWTTQLLAKLVRRRFQRSVTDECIRQHLDRAGAVCRRPTWTVKHKAQAQPGYAQKKAGLQGS
jgi:transposase